MSDVKSPARAEAWKLVPVEPTEAMMDAVDQAYEAFEKSADGAWYGAASVYRAMLAAAPASAEASFRDGLNAAAEYLLACDDYGDRFKAEEIRKLQSPASPPAEALPSQTSGAEAGGSVNLAEWRKAMEGVTPGRWNAIPRGPDGYRFGHSFEVRQEDSAPTDKHHWPVRICTQPEDFVRHNPNPDGDWIARCSPVGVSVLLDEIERLRALSSPASEPAGGGVREIEGKLWALSGIAQDAPDGWTRLNASARELIQGAAREFTHLRKTAAAGMGVIASLAAAISLLERTPKAKKAAPSDRMFDQMLSDYRKALDEARAALSSPASSSPGEAEALQSGVDVEAIARVIYEAFPAHTNSTGRLVDWDELLTMRATYYIDLLDQCRTQARAVIASLSSAPAQEDGSKDLGAHPRGSGQSAGEVEFIQPGAKKAGDRISLPGGWYYERYNDDGVVFSLRTPSGRGFGIKGTGCGLYTETAQSFAKAMWQANEVRS